MLNIEIRDFDSFEKEISLLQKSQSKDLNVFLKISHYETAKTIQTNPTKPKQEITGAYFLKLIDLSQTFQEK